MHIIWKSGLIPFRLYQRKYLLSTPSPLHMISIDAKDISSFLQTVKSIKKLLQHRQLKQFLSYFMLFTVTFSYFYLPVSFPISRTGPVSLLTGEQTKQAIRQRKQSFAGTSQSPDIYHYSERVDKLISIITLFQRFPLCKASDAYPAWVPEPKYLYANTSNFPDHCISKRYPFFQIPP